MARDYDSQLLESVAVRRRRMRDALLFGAGRARRTADERLAKVFAGMAIAAVLCAGCVGWSFIQNTLAKQKAEQQQQRQQQPQGLVRPYGWLSAVPTQPRRLSSAQASSPTYAMETKPSKPTHS